MAARKLVAEKRCRLSKRSRKQAHKEKKSVRRLNLKKYGSKPSAVQALFETCKEIFSDCGPGVVPPPEDVNRLRSILDKMDASDVGITENMTYFQHLEPRGSPRITYLNLYECDKFSICIFCLPPSSVIPLHNHPGMTVFSKLLFGSMHVKAYDWADSDHSAAAAAAGSGMRLARVKTDAIFTAPCRTSVLYPEDGGNMHCFTARTACAVLDVLGPPYSIDEEGRDCTYYNDLPFYNDSGDKKPVAGIALLEERTELDDLVVVGAKYMGPRIVDHH